MQPMSFEEMYRNFRRPVQAQTERLVGDFHEAEDLAQETFLRIYCRWPSLKNAAAAPTWVRRIARNTAVDRLRRRTRLRFQSLAEGLLSAGPPAPDEDGLLPDLVAALEKLPTKLGITLLLHAVDRYSPQEISRLTGTSPSNVKVRLHRARSQLGRTWRAVSGRTDAR